MKPTIEPGRKAPALGLKDQDGQTHRLPDYAGRWVVLYFYPRDATPGCTKEACAFRDAAADLEDAGAAVLGVSPDGEASHAKFAQKQSLGFPLLADTKQAVSTRYGCLLYTSPSPRDQRGSRMPSSA